MGVDVGGRRKAFDVALIEDRKLVWLRARQSAEDVAGAVGEVAPRVVAVDSPRSCAEPGATLRPEEKELRDAIECFPTAAWTRWHGPRAGRSRSAWTREGLAASELEGVPPRTNQDARDAIAAALTARDYDQGRYQAFGQIVVPRSA